MQDRNTHINEETEKCRSMAAVMLFLLGKDRKTEHNTHFCVPLEPVFTRDCGSGVHFIDEPMNGLDPIGIHETRKYLLQLCRERGTTIFISSHVLNEIEQLADVIGVINEGKLLEETSLQELYRQNRRYAEFEVSDVNRAALILERQFCVSDYAIIGNGILRLYERLDSRAEMNSSFVKDGITVTNVSIGAGKLEDYFTKLVGGEGIG